MNRHIIWLFQFIKRKEFPVYLVFLIALMSTIGWLSGKLGLASFSPDYIPIAPINVVILIILTSAFLFRLKLERTKLSSFFTTVIILLVLFVCLSILIIFINGFSFDIEGVMLKNPARFGNVVIGRISPISSSLYILICISILCLESKEVKYIGGGISLLVFFISLVLLIGYLYNAPLLYGSKIIPVSLPASICFFLLSGTLMRLYGFRYLTFNLIKANKVQYILLKSFLPIVIFIIILQGFLDNVWSFNQINPPLTGALILLIVITLTTVIVYRVSTIIGAQLLKAENQLKESEEKFRSTMEHSADAIFITNKSGKYVYTNKSACDMLGYSYEELVDKTFADLSPPDKLNEYFEIFKKVLTGQGNVFAEVEVLKKDGNFILTELNAVLLPDGTVYASCRDITQRKESEIALKENATRLKLISDYNYDWEFWLSDEKEFKYNSPSCERISGYNPDDFLNDRDLIIKIIYPEDIEKYSEHLELERKDEPCNGLDFRIITRSGDIRWINHVCQPVYDKQGIILGRRGSNCDITGRKNAEEAVNNLNKKLSELNSDKDRFIAILGHDLKSPFNNLLGLSNVLIENLPDLSGKEIEELANSINTTAKKTYSLLDEILMWAGSQQGKIPFSPGMQNMTEICNQVLESLRMTARSKNIAFEYLWHDNIIIFADSFMLKVILRNLISNAIKFTNHQGKIRISAVRTGETTQITVSDNGVGINSENLSKLFDITEVLSTPGTAGESGTGLGLLLCKEFVDKHGGKIWVESTVGKGSQFHVTI